jgi:hypothetical protein
VGRVLDARALVLPKESISIPAGGGHGLVARVRWAWATQVTGSRGREGGLGAGLDDAMQGADDALAFFRIRHRLHGMHIANYMVCII